MGKIKAALDTGALRIGNTIATPLRRWGELINEAVFNVLKQAKSSVKNTAEVGKQTVDALADNFLNFSKVEGKRYQRLVKWWINLASAVTRRPAMIASASVLSALNQWIWKPFTKLAPGKLFKGLANATRIFSKKKGFDFAQYDTHETKWDTRINQIKEKRIGFFGVWWSAPVAEAKKSEEAKKVEAPKVEDKKPIEPKKEEPKKEEPKKEEIKKVEEPKKIDETSDKKKDSPASKPSDTPPKTIDEIKKNDAAKSEKKEKDEQNQKFPKWETLDDKFKKEYRMQYLTMIKNKPTKEWIVARGKEAKMWDTPEEILKNFKEKDPTFVWYVESEILNKAA